MARIDRALWDRMLALDETALTAAVGKWVDRGSVRAMLKRRDVMKAAIDDDAQDEGRSAGLRQIAMRRVPAGWRSLDRSVTRAVPLCAGAAPHRRDRAIVAIGDVHGAATAFAAILQRAGLIDETAAMDRRQRDPRPDRRHDRSRHGDARGARPADGARAAGAEGTRPGPRAARQSRSHEHARPDARCVPEIFATFGGEAAMRAAFGPNGQYGRWLRRKPDHRRRRRDGLHARRASTRTSRRPHSSEVNRRVRREIEAWDAGVRVMVEPQAGAGGSGIPRGDRGCPGRIQRLNALHAEGKTPADAADLAARCSAGRQHRHVVALPC